MINAWHLMTAHSNARGHGRRLRRWRSRSSSAPRWVSRPASASEPAAGLRRRATHRRLLRRRRTRMARLRRPRPDRRASSRKGPCRPTQPTDCSAARSASARGRLPVRPQSAESGCGRADCRQPARAFDPARRTGVRRRPRIRPDTRHRRQPRPRGTQRARDARRVRHRRAAGHDHLRRSGPTRSPYACRRNARGGRGGERRAARASGGKPLTRHGQLTVESRPAGAQVFIDGRLVGTTPLSLAEVPAGDHALHLDHDGYRRWSSAIRIVASQPQ